MIQYVDLVTCIEKWEIGYVQALYKKKWPREATLNYKIDNY